MKEIFMVDLPDGHKYGFPKICPPEVWKSSGKEFDEWAVREGYPASQIKFATLYVQCWVEKEKDDA